MSCFHGPAVEGSFSIMGDIIDPKSARMNIETFSAIQTVKYGLRASQKSALEYFERKNHLNDPIDINMCRNLEGARGKYDKELEVKREEVQAKKQKLSLKAQQLQSNCNCISPGPNFVLPISVGSSLPLLNFSLFTFFVGRRAANII